ncbi:MAG TPA: hypothetical protein VLH77_04395 [Gammaproteobacteria bacterium]|nr:hypothetical protein [Gammaproteobacteria bacterium]
MKKLSLLSISLLMAGNTCAMDAEEPGTPRTRFLRAQLKNSMSLGYPVISAALRLEQVHRLSEACSKLSSNEINAETFKAVADDVGANMLVQNQEKQLSEYLKDAQRKRTLIHSIQSKAEVEIVAEEAKMTQAAESLKTMCAKHFGQQAYVPEEYHTIKHNLAFYYASRETLRQDVLQLKTWINSNE